MKDIYNKNNMNKFYNELNSLLNKHEVYIYAAYAESYECNYYYDDPDYIPVKIKPHIVVEHKAGDIIPDIVDGRISMGNVDEYSYNKNNMNKFYNELNSLFDKYHVKMHLCYWEDYDYDDYDEDNVPICLGIYPYVVFEDYDGHDVWKLIDEKISMA